MALTDDDRALIARARQLADTHGDAALRQVTGNQDLQAADTVTCSTDALAAAQHLIFAVAAIAERLDSENSRLRNDRARYRVQLHLPADDDDQEALREAGQPSRCGDHHASGVTNCTRETGHDGAHHNGSGLTWSGGTAPAQRTTQVHCPDCGTDFQGYAGACCPNCSRVIM